MFIQLPFVDSHKKINNLKEDSKLIQILIFPKLPGAFEVLIRRNIM